MIIESHELARNVVTQPPWVHRRFSDDMHPDKNDANILYQGCPSLAQSKSLIRWSADAPEIASWVENNLELRITQPSRNISSRWIKVIGWKGGHDIDEKRTLDDILSASKANDRHVQNGLYDLEYHCVRRNVSTLFTQARKQLGFCRWTSDMG